MPRAAGKSSYGDLVSRTLDSVVNGVSQQPVTVRLASQCEEQINLHSSVADGARRRPPSEYKATLHTSALPNAGYKAHIRHRDSTKQHLVLIEDGDIRVWNMLTGVECSILGTDVFSFQSENVTVLTDQTAAANNTTTNDLNLLPAATDDSGFYIGMEHKFNAFDIEVSTAGTGTYTMGFEYSKGGGTWGQMSGYGLATEERYKTVATHSHTFTKPTDWAQDTVNGVEGYWLRAWWGAGTITINPLGKRVRIHNQSYLDIAGTDASQAFAVISVADYSFIVNKETTVAMSGRTSAERTPAFLIHAQEGWQGGELWYHKLGTDDKSAIITATLGGSTGSPRPPGDLPKNLIGDLYKAANYGAEWTFTDMVSVMYGYQNDFPSSAAQTVGKPDWIYSNEVYAFIGEQTQRFSDLPAKAPAGFTTEITGGDGNEDDNYWVMFDGDQNVWVETVAPAQDNEFDKSTLPHVLIQVSVGGGAGGEDEFTFGPPAWAARGVGDTVSAPEPSFVGQTISDIVFHKNRLGIIAGESVALSETGEYFNFWPTTVTSIVDSDPIDAAGTNNRVGTIDYAIPFNEKLYLFSSVGGFQNVLRAAGNEKVGLTAANAELPEASAFPVSALARPVAAGNAVLFAVDREVASSIFEYTIGDNGPEADDVTSHIPTYIPQNIKEIAACPRENIAVCLSSSQPYKLYAYSWFFNRGSKVQYAWSTWTFDDSYNIIACGWIESDLYIVVKRTDGLHLEKLAMNTLTEGGLAHRVYLDTLEQKTGVYTVADNLTRWTPSCASNPASYGNFRAVLSHASWAANMGQSFDLQYEAATGKLYTEGDYSAYSAHIGRLYDFTYEFSKPILMVADASAGTEVAVTQGRLNIGKWKILTRNSGGYYAQVSSEEVNPAEITVAEDSYIYYAPDKIVNAGTVGPVHPMPVDEFLFDVGMEGRYAKIEIKGQSHLPFTLVGAEWEGRYSTRSERI